VLYGALADAVLTVHLAFIVFVACGSLIVLRWPRAAWFHLPSLAWAVAVECLGLGCPLTPLEVSWRRSAGGAGYPGGFIDHYVGALVYPPGLTRAIEVVLGTTLVAVNGAVYAFLIRRRGRIPR
jgi:hypothetical protein